MRTAWSNTERSDPCNCTRCCTTHDNAAEHEDSPPRGKVPRLDESGNERNTEPGRSGNMLDMGFSMSVEKNHQQTFQSMVEVDDDGNRRLTVRQDQRGRWVPIKGHRHQTIDELRTERQNFCMGILPDSEGFGSHEAKSRGRPR